MLLRESDQRYWVESVYWRSLHRSGPSSDLVLGSSDPKELVERNPELVVVYSITIILTFFI
mgnify:FL=1